MDADIPPKPYHHPDERLKSLEITVSFLAAVTLLHQGLSMNPWLSQGLAFICAAAVGQLFRPRLSLAKLGIWVAIFCAFLAIELGVHLLIHRH